MHHGLLTARELSELIECTMARIYDYIDLGIPHQKRYIKSIERELKLFDKFEALEWIRKNARSRIRQNVIDVLNTYKRNFNQKRYVTLGLEEVMSLLGLKSIDIAEMLGVSRSSVVAWKLCKNTMRQDKLILLSEALGLDHKLITGEREITELDKVRLSRSALNKEIKLYA